MNTTINRLLDLDYAAIKAAWYRKIAAFPIKAARIIRTRLNPKSIFYRFSGKHRRIIKFTGVANNQDSVIFFATFYHLLMRIRLLSRPQKYDALICQSFLDDAFINTEKPKVFFTLEPIGGMTDETVKNIADQRLKPFIYRFDEPDAEKRLFYPAIPENRRPLIKKLERNLYSRRAKTCCIISRYAENGALNLLAERIKLVKAMGADVDIYGFEPWQGSNKWQEIGHYLGPAGNKLQTLEKYYFAISFENTDSPGYITEKIFDAMMAGTVPLYWGGGYLDDSLPAQCYVDCRNREANAVYVEIKAYPFEKIVNFRKAAIDFFKSPGAERFTHRYWAKAVIERLQAQIDAGK